VSRFPSAGLALRTEQKSLLTGRLSALYVGGRNARSSRDRVAIVQEGNAENPALVGPMLSRSCVCSLGWGEEQMMRQTFGQAYEEHVRHTGQLPKLRT